MTTQQAILKSIEGGYKEGHIYGREGDVYILINDHGDRCGSLTEEKILLDHRFWQSLGTAIGWENESECPLACCGGICPIDIPMWQSQWHLFIDHLAKEKDIGSFFETL